MKVVFFIVQLQKFFYWLKSFHSFSVTKSYNGLLCFGSWLANSMTCLNSLSSTCTSMSDQTDMTILSKLLSGTFSWIPLTTTLLRLPYWAKSLWFDSSMPTLFSSFSHFTFSLAFSSCNFWITMPFRLMISSFRYQTVNALNYGFFQFI